MEYIKPLAEGKITNSSSSESKSVKPGVSASNSINRLGNEDCEDGLCAIMGGKRKNKSRRKRRRDSRKKKSRRRKRRGKRKTKKSKKSRKKTNKLRKRR